MIRDLHPHTRPQRAADPEGVPEQARALGYEPSDWDVRKVALVLAGLGGFLGLTVVAGLLSLAWLRPGWASIGAEQAALRFRSPAPPLEAYPDSVRPVIEATQAERLRRAPVPIDKAMRQVAAQGWRPAELPR